MSKSLLSRIANYDMQKPIELTNEEIEVFRTLASVQGCTVRIVGGWVRDKVL